MVLGAPSRPRRRLAESDPAVKQRWNYKTRYRLTPEAVTALLANQKGCAICRVRQSGRWCVDHDHITNEVRGVLCHRCNILLAAVEDARFLASALKYLSRQ